MVRPFSGSLMGEVSADLALLLPKTADWHREFIAQGGRESVWPPNFFAAHSALSSGIMAQALWDMDRRGLAASGRATGTGARRPWQNPVVTRFRNQTNSILALGSRRRTRGNMTKQIYDESFFGDQLAASSISAAILAPIVLSAVHAKSAIDVGCGIGCWAAELLSHGVDVRGVDGDWVDPDQLRIPIHHFISHDLRQTFRLGESFDLAACIEVAEHLPPNRADGLVDDLVRLAPCILFSAAVPDQGGAGHLNEQPLSYWSARFATHRYKPVDCIRSAIWDDSRVAWWLRQNLVFFVHPDHPLLRSWPEGASDLYHPLFVEFLSMRAKQPSLRALIKAFLPALRVAISARLQHLR